MSKGLPIMVELEALLVQVREKQDRAVLRRIA